MRREIKFRAWDLEKRRYGEVRCINYNFEGEIDSVVCWFSVHEREVYLPGGTFIIEQSTGLKDKNGKEIYEGDIVNLEYYERPEGKKRWHKTYPRKGTKDINVVGFEDGYFKFYEGDENGYGSELSFSDYGEWGVKDGTYKYIATVIGNIHENPELLKDKG